MNGIHRVASISAFAWAFLVLAGFATIALLAPIRNYDVYDIQGGMRALVEQPILIIGGQIIFAWAGGALVLMALAFYEWLPVELRLYPARAATAFGGIAGALFLFFGLVGGFASFEMHYVQSVRSITYVQDAYLPLAFVMNRAFASAITVSGLWSASVNWIALCNHALPQFAAYIELAAGVIALLGFVLPGGGFNPLGLLLSALWGILAGVSIVAKLKC